MIRDHFYITLFSNVSQHMYPDNKIAAFTIQLAQPIILDPSEIWEVRLCELSFSERQLLEDNTNDLVYCDLIAPQLIGTTMVRLFRTFNIIRPEDYGVEYQFKNVYYEPVEKRMFRDISIEILNLAGERVPFTDGQTHLKVVLHFRRVITHLYKYDIDTPHTYIYKYDAVRTVLYTPSGGWWRRAWHRPRLFRFAICTARTWYRQFSSLPMEDRAIRTLERC